MSFARQLSVCRTQDNLTISPTEVEWNLARLQRPGMFGDRRIKQVLQPGRYSFNPFAEPEWQPASCLACDVTCARAGSVRKPRRVRIENPMWQQTQGLDWTLFLPKGSKAISVPTDEADDAGLGYYGCRLIEPNDVISLNHRSIIVNFHYEEDYLQRYVIAGLGGSSIEQHDFAHVDTPLNRHSGHLVIGRIDPLGQTLELTAFVVKPMHRVYIPAQTIHTNDYLLGTWETLLSSACEFPSAQIKPSSDDPSQLIEEHMLPALAFCD